MGFRLQQKIEIPTHIEVMSKSEFGREASTSQDSPL